MPFEPFPPVEPVTHAPLNQVFIVHDIKKLMQTCDTLHDLLIGHTHDDVRLSLGNVLPTNIPQLEQNLMSLPEFTPEKVIKLQNNGVFCKSIIQHIGCSK